MSYLGHMDFNFIPVIRTSGLLFLPFRFTWFNSGLWRGQILSWRHKIKTLKFLGSLLVLQCAGFAERVFLVKVCLLLFLMKITHTKVAVNSPTLRSTLSSWWKCLWMPMAKASSDSKCHLVRETLSRCTVKYFSLFANYSWNTKMCVKFHVPSVQNWLYLTLFSDGLHVILIFFN